MKRIEGVDALAKEMGISKDKLKSSFADMTAIAKGEKKDPFGKKFFHNNIFDKDDDVFAVAHMTPVLHYTMGGLHITPHSEVVGNGSKPIPGLFACGEIGGGVHGANRLGGSSLLGCVVYGRVAGASAASYLLSQASSGKIAAQRLGQVAGHLETVVKYDPSSGKVTLEFGGQGAQASTSASAASQQTSAAAPAPKAPAKKSQEAQAKPTKQFTLDDLKKHTSKDDVWVAVNGEVLDVTSFLDDHPGGAKAIMLYAGRDATEEFNMLHDKSVVQKYAANTIIGTLKE